MLFRSPIGILLVQDATDGSIMVNHPASFTDLPDLPENYIWAGATNDEIKLHYLSPTSFKRTYDAINDEWTFQLADNIEFGGYKFSSDGSLSSKIETKVSSNNIGYNVSTPVVVDRFGTNYRSAKYLVQISGISSNGVDTVYQIGEILVIHNGTAAFSTEYGNVTTFNEERLGVFDAYVDTLTSEVVLVFQKSGNINNQVQVKAVRTSILV